MYAHACVQSCISGIVAEDRFLSSVVCVWVWVEVSEFVQTQHSCFEEGLWEGLTPAGQHRTPPSSCFDRQHCTSQTFSLFSFIRQAKDLLWFLRQNVETALYLRVPDENQKVSIPFTYLLKLSKLQFVDMV